MTRLMNAPFTAVAGQRNVGSGASLWQSGGWKVTAAILLAVWLGHLQAADFNGASIWAVSSDPGILPNDQIVLNVVDNALVVHITTLPNAEGEVEINFYALIDNEPTRLSFNHSESKRPASPAPFRLLRVD